MAARKKLIYSLFVLVGVYVVGTAGYVVIESDPRPTVGEAAYMTVITLSTVGFTEVWELSSAGRAWTGCVIIFGIVTVSFAVTSLFTLFVSGELQSLRGRKKVETQIKQMQDHVIICGYGRMGALAVEDLTRARVPLVVVEVNKRAQRELLDASLVHVIGDATEEQVLERAGLERARAVVAVLPHDVDNVFITLTVHTLRPEVTIIARAEQPRTEMKLVRAGASRVVCPQVIGARAIGNIVLRPNVTDFVEVARKGVELEMDEYVLGAASPLVGRALSEARVRSHAAATVVAIKRASGKTLYTPDANEVLERGDTLIMVGRAGMSDRLGELEKSGW